MASNVNIILLSDILEHKKRKEKELEYYLGKQKDLEIKVSWIVQELNLTKYIIDIIKKETVVEIKRK